MSKSLQARVEEEAHEIIDELADELNLDVPFYPEVYWVNKKFRFSSLGLPEKDREFFDYTKNNNKSAYLYRPKIILVGKRNLSSISEEAGHFLHFINSGLNFVGKNKNEVVALSSIVEMFGYFCSKLIDPTRENYLNGTPDILLDRDSCIEELAAEWIELKEIDLDNVHPRRTKKQKMERIVNQYVDMREFMIYQQGYGLGEKLFDAYISDEIPKEEIKILISRGFSQKNSAIVEFCRLKYNVLNFSETYK